MLTTYSNERLRERARAGEDAIRDYGRGSSEDRDTAAKDVVSDILTALFGPAGKLVDVPGASDGRCKVELDSVAVENASALIDAALQSYFGDAEDYVEIAEEPEAPAPFEVVAIVFVQHPDEFSPTEDLEDAWGRYQRGEDVTQAELRALDEQRADWALDQLS